MQSLILLKEWKYNRDAKCNFFYDGTDWRSQCTKINQAANPVNFQLTGTTGTAASQILSVTFNSPWKARVSIKASAIHNAWTNTRDENIASNASVFLNSTANTALTSANSRYQNTFQLVHMHSTKLLWSMEVQPGDHTQVERTACNIDMNVSSQTLVVDVK